MTKKKNAHYNKQNNTKHKATWKVTQNDYKELVCLLRDI